MGTSPLYKCQLPSPVSGVSSVAGEPRAKFHNYPPRQSRDGTGAGGKVGHLGEELAGLGPTF